MVEIGYEVVWTKRSQKQMRQVFKHISKDSLKNASKVIQEIADAVYKAAPNPGIYGADKYKVDNGGVRSSFLYILLCNYTLSTPASSN